MKEHAPPAYRREFELVRCCFRTRLEPDHVERIRRLVQEGVQWEQVIQLAEFHGGRSLLYKSLTEADPDAVPDEVRGLLQQLAQATSIFNLFLAKELGRLLRVFEANAIPALALKGPALAQVAYGDVGMRSCGDLDILVRKRDFDAVQRLLVEDGYAPHQTVLRYQGIRKKLYLWLARQYPFKRGAGVFNVDLHTAVMPPLYYYAVDFETLWRRSDVVALAETQVRSCQPEDLLQILCFHGTKNRWETLKYIGDVAELIRANQGLDWDIVLQRARRTHAERILFLGLYLAHALLDARLPEKVLLKMEEKRIVRSMGDRLIEKLPDQMRLGIAGFGERFGFHLTLQDTLATKARYSAFALLRRALDPGDDK